jgi:hypothetical protein
MGLFKRKLGDSTQLPDRIVGLVADLNALVDKDVRAGAWAYLIEAEGRPAAVRFLSLLAPEFGQGYLSPICAAFARYEKSTTGVDLAGIELDDVRECRAASAFEQRAAEAQARAWGRISERAVARRLSTLYGSSGRSF